MHIFDSKEKKRVLFEPIDGKNVRIYVCGPTVYDDSHLGHARSGLVFDLLRRILKSLNYNVTFVKNFTDIDDKIVKKMKTTGKTLHELTTHYINSYKKEMNALGVQDADIEPKATESLIFMYEMIQNLLRKGNAYDIEDGIYFDTSKDSKYLSISKQKLDDSQARIEENNQKRDSKDFALWKRVDKKEIGFESPFGYGRPGWHLECSAMIKHYLAGSGNFQIDIHGGGADLLFPHHENEAAQTRCDSDIELAKYWMHNGFVTINNEKMSKSLGNSFFLKDALAKYNGEVLRFYLISTHYRTDLNFNEEDLIASKKRLDKLYRLKKRLIKPKKVKPNAQFKELFLNALKDDLNISKALSEIDEMVKKSNENLDNNPNGKSVHYEIFANLELIREVLGIGEIDTYEYFKLGLNQDEKRLIEDLIIQRDEAKAKKDYKKADEIRDKLSNLNINVLDTPNGTFWEKVE